SASSLPMPGYCDACPGNTNATLPIAIPLRSGERRRGRELLFDFFVDSRFGETCSDADGVFYGIGVGPAVADDADAANAKEGRAAVFGVINRFLQALERALGQERAQL